MGRIAASIAAYALVLNVMLTSALLASISPPQFNALHELCLNGSSAKPAVANDGDDRAAPLIRCPLCLSPAVIALPPDSPAPAIRIAVPALIRSAPHDTVVAQARTADHQARGPPSLG